MKDKIIKNFTLWDFIVLLILIVILIPFALSALIGFIDQNYTVFFINLGLFIFTLFGIIKYVKKLLLGLKNSDSSKGLKEEEINK